MTSEAELALEPRAHCYRCDKPAIACLCGRIPRVHNRTPIVIVQHKREARHALGTVRIADLGLERRAITVLAGSQRSGSQPPDWLPAGAGLLYPGESARELAEVPSAERPRCLVVIDGTWHQARALFRDHLWLQGLPRYKLTPSAPSRYRLRKEPAADYVSTIEAITQALSILEPETESGGLIDAFDALIDDQIHHAHTRARIPRKRERRRFEWRSLPHALLEDYARLVVVYGEATHPHGDLSRQTELVQWTALRVRDASTFDCALLPPGGMPSAGHLRHLMLDAETVAAGATVEEFRERWCGFIRRDAILAAWNPRTLGLLERTLGAAPSGFGLKGVYHRVRQTPGDLSQITALERSQALPAELLTALGRIRGRARQRMTNALGVALLLRARALGEHEPADIAKGP